MKKRQAVNVLHITTTKGSTWEYLFIEVVGVKTWVATDPTPVVKSKAVLQQVLAQYPDTKFKIKHKHAVGPPPQQVLPDSARTEDVTWVFDPDTISTKH